MMNFSEINMFICNIGFILYIWVDVFYNYCVDRIKNAIIYVCFENNWFTYTLLLIAYTIYDLLVFTYKILKFMSNARYGDLDEFIE